MKLTNDTVKKLIATQERRLTLEELAAVAAYAFDQREINEQNELQLQSGRVISPEIVNAELGEALVAPFAYLDHLLFASNRRWRVHNATDTRRHAYDSAYHARRFGITDDVVTIVLLHDVLEYTCKNLPAMQARIDELRGLYGDYVARHTGVLADVQSIIIGDVSRKVQRDGVRITTAINFKKYLDRITSGTTDSMRRKYDAEFKGVERIITSLTQKNFNAHENLDVHFNIYEHMREQAAAGFIERIFSTARKLVETEAPDYYVPLVVRAASYIDRIRTMQGGQEVQTLEETMQFMAKLSSFDKLLAQSSIANAPIQAMTYALSCEAILQTRLLIEGYRNRDSAFLTMKQKIAGMLTTMERTYAQSIVS